MFIISVVHWDAKTNKCEFSSNLDGNPEVILLQLHLFTNPVFLVMMYKYFMINCAI